MSALDWIVVALYLAGSTALGLALARRGSRSMVDFFVGGRAVPWWLAATSMAATTFNVDTPLYVTGLVARAGVAGNWEWWSFALAHVLLAVLLARLWRRAAVLTDAELVELRYSGRPAALLRATRAFLFAVPLNCLGIGYAMLAMRKVIVALGLLDGLTWLPGDPQLWAVVVVLGITLAYTSVSGLWGVIATDFLQYLLAMTGAFVVAVYAVREAGGLGALTATLRASGQGHRLDLVPLGPDAMLPLGTFLGYLGIQWWAFKNSDGGGMFIQRLSSTANEREATKAAHLFNVLNYVVRTWPWVVVGLAALVVLPGLADPERAYPMLMVRYLPSGVLGLVFLLILVGTGTGALLLLRWFWWRVNAWAEITAMLVGLVLAILVSTLPALKGLPFGAKLACTTFGSMACWLPVLFLTRPEPAATLDAFYARTRPPGAWGVVRARTGLTAADSLARAAWQWLIWVTVILGGTVGIGWVLLR
ncbi:MAG: sodium:proline symporter [Gemmatimonadetes bacterium]|nr:sodium:proline symporter [Gemmatimonadota bacterium]